MLGPDIILSSFAGEVAGLPFHIDNDGRLTLNCDSVDDAIKVLRRLTGRVPVTEPAEERPATWPTTQKQVAPVKVPKPKKIEAPKPEKTAAPSKLLTGETIAAACVRVITAAGEAIHYKALAAALGVGEPNAGVACANEVNKAVPRLVRVSPGTYSTPELERRDLRDDDVVELAPAVVAEASPVAVAPPEPPQQEAPPEAPAAGVVYEVSWEVQGPASSVAVVADDATDAVDEEPKPAPTPRQFTPESIDKLVTKLAAMKSPMQVVNQLRAAGIETDAGIAKFIDKYKGSIPVFASMPSDKVLARVGTLAASMLH